MKASIAAMRSSTDPAQAGSAVTYGSEAAGSKEDFAARTAPTGNSDRQAGLAPDRRARQAAMTARAPPVSATCPLVWAATVNLGRPGRVTLDYAGHGPGRSRPVCDTGFLG